MFKEISSLNLKHLLLPQNQCLQKWQACLWRLFWKAGTLKNPRTMQYYVKSMWKEKWRHHMNRRMKRKWFARDRPKVCLWSWGSKDAILKTRKLWERTMDSHFFFFWLCFTNIPQWAYFITRKSWWTWLFSPKPFYLTGYICGCDSQL